MSRLLPDACRCFSTCRLPHAKLFLALTVVFGISTAIPNDSLRAGSVVCLAAPDCFREAVRAVDRRDTESARSLLNELIQQFPNSNWAGRASLILGRTYEEQGDRQAIVHLLTVLRELPILGDYAYYHLGEILFAASEWNGAATAYELVNVRYPDSILRSQALYRAAESWFQGDDCRRARERQASFLSTFPRHALVPAILLRQGDCEQKNGDKVAATVTYRRIWIQFAASPQATEAAFRLQTLKEKGLILPDVTAQDWWTRSKVLFEAAQYPPAIHALQEALKVPHAPIDRPQALLNLGIARIRLKQYEEARPVLADLVRSRSGSVSQEAALWLGRLYLRQGQDEALLDLARDVDAGLLSGEQKAKFLVLLGAQHADRGRSEKAINTYRQAAETAGPGATAVEALWQAGWLHYKDARYGDAYRTFEDSQRVQPVGPSALQALYWRARSLDKLGERQRALDTIQTLCKEALNSYYCQIGRARNGWVQALERELPAANGSVALEVSEFQDPAILGDGHYQRAIELRMIGWQREAAEELATLIARVGQDRVAALWLARLFGSAGEYYRSLSLIRSYFPEVLDRGGGTVAKEFWELAYPGGYFPFIQTMNGIEPHLVTAVIREESSYNPAAVSTAGALGLMQVMPQTGQKVAAQLGTADFTRDRLFEPCYNIRLGSHYLRQLGEKFGNNLVYVIAAYNAGPEIVAKWMQQFGNTDTDEFIESIPYTETRNYVKKVLRSYGEYKRIYRLTGPDAFLDKGC